MPAFVVRYGSETNQNGSNEFSHYGVLGMKWGVRKERELKGNERIGRSKQKRSENIQTPVGEAKIEFYDASKKRHDNEMMKYVETTMQPFRYATKKLAQKRFDSLTKTYINYSEDQLKYLTNHDAPNNIRTMNCFHCSMAYELRKRGYNVQAKEIRGGWDFEVQHAFDIKDGFSVKIDEQIGSDNRERAKACYDVIAKQCESYGEGARGQIGIQYYDYNSGHSMNWEVKDGKFRIIDSQGMDRDTYEIFMHAEADVNVTRLDNADVLPGVTDFVEPYERTNEEEELAEKKRKINEANRRHKLELEEKAREEASAKKDNDSIMSKVEYFISNVGKVTKELVDKGKDFVSKLLNIQDNVSSTSRPSTNTEQTYITPNEKNRRKDASYRSKSRLERWM